MQSRGSVEGPSSRGRLPGALEVQSIMHSSTAGDSAIASPIDSTFDMKSSVGTLTRSSSTSSRQSHTRTWSSQDHRGSSKRLSVTLPVQTAEVGNPNRRSMSPRKAIVAPPTTILEDMAAPTGPTDSTFLTALAAQERRVLELKEELHKAEQGLRKLKSDWAAHEAQKKRYDAKRVQQMRPLSTALPDADPREEDVDGGSAWMTQEMQRRKSLLHGTRSSNRRVFSGSRQARALSLLKTGAGQNGRSQQMESAPSSPTVPKSPSAPKSPGRPSLPSRASTDYDLKREVVTRADANIDLGIPREVLLKTGRQMATDFKEGLWTFIEDLRQATVGDEALEGDPGPGRSPLRPEDIQKPAKPRTTKPTANSTAKLHRQSTLATATSRPASRSPGRQVSKRNGDLIDIGGSFWKEHGLNETKAADAAVVRKGSRRKVTTPQKPTQERIDSADCWDNWDSPLPPEDKASTIPKSQDQGQASGGEQGDALPWPQLTKLSPGNLRRTASHLMNEWEKSLSPPEQTQPDYIAQSTGPTRDLKAD